MHKFNKQILRTPHIYSFVSVEGTPVTVSKQYDEQTDVNIA